MECIIVLKDEVNCRLVGLDAGMSKILYDRFRFEVEGARHQPKVKLGMWDGKVSLYSKENDTYINFLPIILPIILKSGYKIKIDDRRKKLISLNFEPIDENYFIDYSDKYGNPITLRDYQIALVNLALSQDRGGIGLAGTGAGKTLMTAAICKEFNNKKIKCVVIVPSKSLLTQTFDTLKSLGVNIKMFGGKNKTLDADTIISTWQTLQNVPTLMHDFNMFLVDECHGAQSKVLNSLLNEYGRNIQYRYGLTATLPKLELNSMSVTAALGNPFYEIPSHKLIELGHLAKLNIEIKQLEEDLHPEYQEYIDSIQKSNILSNDIYSYEMFKTKYFPDYNAEKNYIRRKNTRLDFLVGEIVSAAELGNTFTLVDSIQFGKKLVKAIKGQTDLEHVYFVYGNDDTKIRKEIYDLFENNDNVVVVATVHCAGTGIDISRIYYLLLIDMGKSFIRTLQTIGRGLRKAPDKDTILAIDYSSDLKYSKRHLTIRKSYYNEAKYPFRVIKVKY